MLDQTTPALTVEVIWLSAADGVLRFRAARQRADHGAHPDDVARQLSGLTPCIPGALLHSTSWRYHEGTVVLTYAALPDLNPATAMPVIVDAMRHGGGPLTPSPTVVEVDAVAAHACRHLALLAADDPQVSLMSAGDVWALIGKLPAAPAGALHGTPLADNGAPR